MLAKGIGMAWELGFSLPLSECLNKLIHCGGAGGESTATRVLE